MRLAVFPLRWEVPLVMLALGVLLGGLWTNHSLQDAYEQVETSRLEATRFIAVFVGPQLEAFYRHGEIRRAETFLNRLSADAELHRVLLIDSDDTVIYSSRFEEGGQSFASLGLGGLSGMRRQALEQGRDLVELSEDRNRVYGAFPVQIAVPDETLGHRYGVLLVDSDLRFLKEQARQLAVRHLLQTLGVLLILCLLASLLLWRLVTRRLRRLMLATERLADGDTGARARLKGSDELATFGRAFDMMAERIEAAQRDLAEREAGFRQLIEHGTDIISVIDDRGIVRFVSPSVRRILGRAAEEVVGQEVFRLLHPEDRSAAVERLATTLAGSMTTPPVEVRLRHADGHWVVLEAVGNSPPERRERGEVVVNARDVTEWKVLQEQLRQSQKMKAVGQLAGGIAHDFNNLLTAILGYCDLLDDDLPADSPSRVSTAEIRQAGQRGGTLVRQLLAFGRKQVLRLEDLELHSVVVAMEGLLRRTLGERVEMEIVPAEVPCRVRADRGQLEQVLLNLVVNSRDAIPRGGHLRIESRPVEAAQIPAGRLPVDAPEHGVLLTVADTGVGVAEAIREEIFDPFFTTKTGGEGTGLGLAMVHGIVTQSGGSIWVESQPGRGATFFIWLPRVEASAPRTEAAAAHAPAVPDQPVGSPPGLAGLPGQPEGAGGAGGSERLPTAGASGPSRPEPPAGNVALIVEDERPIRKIVSMILARHGYRTAEAESVCTAREILDELSGQDGSPSLLVCDMVLPDGSGSEIAELVNRRHPGAAILLMSGYAEEMLEREEGDDQFTFLPKPFSPEQLMGAVTDAFARVLSDRPAPPDRPDRSGPSA